MSVHNSEHNTSNNSDHYDDIYDSVTRISKLDISDPLHLHPNDTTALTVVSIKLKETKNYQVWSCAMLLALKGKNKIGFIDGSCKRSKEDEATISSRESHRIAVGSIASSSQKNQAFAFVSNVPCQVGVLVCNGKIVDSGANQHMTYTNKELDNVINISHLKIKVGHPNRTEACISKIENLILSNGLTLYDAMVIPEYCVTLISVHKLIKVNKVIVAFDENRCYFLNKDLNLKNDLGIGEQCEGLYYYNDKGIKSNTSTFRFQCMLSQHDWHCRLGNPADHVLNVLKDSLNIDKKDNTICCKFCQRAKQTREPFPLSDHKSKSLGDLVHLDLWGPYKGEIPLKMWTECILTATYLINRLPSSMLNGKSPYEMIYKKCPTLSHLRVFGCLCFATIVNNNDKFNSRSKKCVMIGYSNFKKRYRLYSLNKHQFIFYRDVKFFENIFPFKDSKVGKNDSTNVFQDVNHINFFDIEYLEIPNDDERVANDLNKGKSDSISSSEFGSNINTADFLVDSRNDADTSNDFVATVEENVFSKGNLDQNPSSSQGVQMLEGLLDKVFFQRVIMILFLNQREPKINFEAFNYSHWIDAMNPEMDALLRNGTWELVDLPEGRKAIGSKWIYKIKFRSSGEIDRCKARLVAQDFGQKEGIDYEETFSPVVKMVTVSQSKYDYSLYTKSNKEVFLTLLVYVDDIIITGNSVFKIEKFKVFLKSKFMIKDLEKYVLDLLSEYGMLACKPAKTPLMSKLVISNEANLSYAVHCLSQFMHSPLTSHLKIAFKILRYLKSCPGLGVHVTKTSGMFFTAYSDADWAKCTVTRKSVIGYCVFLNNSLVSWKSKKQNILYKSSTEVEYRTLASVTSEVIWISKFLKDLQIENLLHVSLHCDSNSAIKIAANPVFHERTKHLEIDLHFVREKVLKGVVKTVKVDSANQIADILRKGMDTVQHLEFVKNLGMYDVYQVETKGGY
ncbi:ribonuclease H-like domain-containing protein [Tanacetum coccineum]